tara:strand:- start:227 stop:427 length:201 start_codon:yes stop_codon:yes gene_type:complete
MFVKFGHLVGILYYGIGKSPKKRVFSIFDPNNYTAEKIDPAYLAGNFSIQILKKTFFSKNHVMTSF